MTTKSYISDDSEVHLWNPYSMFHFAIAEVVSVSDISILTPEYPLPRGVKRVVGPKIIRSIYGLSDSSFVPMSIEHAFVGDEEMLGIYLTKREIKKDGWSGWGEHRQIRRIEDRLVAFGLEMSRRGVKTRFFLHYSDRTPAELDRLPQELRELVSLGDSLRALSCRQLALSGASTIGFELSSIGVPHAFVLTVKDGESTPYLAWAKHQPNVLDVDASDDDWINQLVECFPEQAPKVLRCGADW